MRMRDKAALSLAPLLIRLALGVTFLWAGLGKVMVTQEYSPEAAAILANAGVINAGASGQPDDAGGSESGDGLSQGETADVVTVSLQQDPFTAADFPDGYSGRRVLGLVIPMHTGANPGYDPDSGEPLSAFWPKALGSGQTALMLAWLVVIGEIACGLAVLVGLLTRLSAIDLGCIIIGAMWLTQLGPATQTSTAILGVLPGHAMFDMAWKDLLWQFMIMCGAFSLALMGPGAVSLDALFFRPKRSDGGADDEAEDDEDED